MADETMPSQVTPNKTMFDRLADTVGRVTAKAWFFAACVALVVAWLPTILVVDSVDTWQLLINTPTTVVTFLLVGLAQNTAARSEAAVQHKLNAIANGHLALLRTFGYEYSDTYRELQAAVGVEQHESSD